MARTILSKKGGCVLTGKVSKVNGLPDRAKISIIPSKQGFYRGIFYSSSVIDIIPDENGDFSVNLPPSSVCGIYTVLISGKRIPIEIKDNELEKRLNGE